LVAETTCSSAKEGKKDWNLGNDDYLWCLEHLKGKKQTGLWAKAALAGGNSPGD
jgi:hypothetical protein